MIETERLLLRPWRDEDREPFWAMAQDPEVMQYLYPISRAEADEAVDRMMALQADFGHCFWALECRAETRFIGFCGVVPPREPTFEYEIGWRLERASWGKGLAFEAAQASLAWVWSNLATPQVVAITLPANLRSRRLMERLGMSQVQDVDFKDLILPEGDVLYRIARPQ